MVFRASIVLFSYGYNLETLVHIWLVISEQRLDRLQLLFDYKSAFARDLSELRRYLYYEHDLELIANKKVYKRSFRFWARREA